MVDEREDDRGREEEGMMWSISRERSAGGVEM